MAVELWNFDPNLTKWRQYGHKEQPWQKAFREREFQQTKVYRSEHEIQDRMYQLECNRIFASLEEVQAYVNDITTRTWFIKMFGPQCITVRFPKVIREDNWCYGSSTRKEIIMSPKNWAMRPHITIHELAHCIVPRKTGGGHGRYFCRVYLELIRRMIGPEAYDLLKKSFLKHKVKFKPRRYVTEDFKESARSRFENIRNKKALSPLNLIGDKNMIRTVKVGRRTFKDRCHAMLYANSHGYVEVRFVWTGYRSDLGKMGELEWTGKYRKKEWTEFHSKLNEINISNASQSSLSTLVVSS